MNVLLESWKVEGYLHQNTEYIKNQYINLAPCFKDINYNIGSKTLL